MTELWQTEFIKIVVLMNYLTNSQSPEGENSELPSNTAWHLYISNSMTLELNVYSPVEPTDECS